MQLIVGNVWTVVTGEAWEVSAMRDYLTIDPETPSFLNDEGEDTRFLTGLLPRVQQDLGVLQLDIVDERTKRGEIDVSTFQPDILPGLVAKGHQLRPYQIQSGRKLLLRGTGCAEVPTGGGKTAIMGAMIKHLLDLGRECVTVLVDRTFLVQQTLAEFEDKGVAPADALGGLSSQPRRRELDRPVVVGTVQSFHQGLKNSDMEIYERLQRTDVLFVDECHHSPSKQAARVIACCPARERWGLTATMSETPGEWGYEELMMEGLLGPLRLVVPGHVLRELGFLAPASLVVCPIQGKIGGYDWRKAYVAGIIEHRPRNGVVLSAVQAMWAARRKTLLFVTEKTHGRRLMRSLAAGGIPALFVTGGGEVMWVAADGSIGSDTWTLKQVASYVERKPRSVVIATQVLDEGVDVPSFNVAILAGGHKKMRRLLQRIGRCMRPVGGETLIIDFWDGHHPFLAAHSKRRMAVYQEEQFPVVTPEELGRRLDVPFTLSSALPYLDDWEG